MIETGGIIVVISARFEIINMAVATDIISKQLEKLLTTGFFFEHGKKTRFCQCLVCRDLHTLSPRINAFV